ncbi:IclR family transcriptional regulator [Roseateles sp. SL47]|uniref:IclR family transcriptional regulator n=1 Tax=Roseateles sp. SL47 TaxID=2995138 RepID=UPI002271132C|nr:IclR family transcriptional regulator [Roseateles sp. SL47]WAC72719.1 IclR family transcriptional regulator [Roseateles sp. SL47]
MSIEDQTEDRSDRGDRGDSAERGDDRRGIQSIEVGGRLLKAAAAQGHPLPLKTLSQAAEMSAAKAHPYLVSFCKLGLMSQDPTTGYYGLGPLAMEMGLIGIQQVDPIRLASAALDTLATELGHTVAIAVWGSHGATIVRTAASPAPIHVTMRHGTVVSLWNTASGPLFAAYRPLDEVKALWADFQRLGDMDLTRRPGSRAPETPAPTWDQFVGLLAEVRGRGMHRSVDSIVEGVSALAVPVFDSETQLALSLTAIGPSGAFDASWEGWIATRLQAAAQDLMRQMGGRAPC